MKAIDNIKADFAGKCDGDSAKAGAAGFLILVVLLVVLWWACSPPSGVVLLWCSDAGLFGFCLSWARSCCLRRFRQRVRRVPPEFLHLGVHGRQRATLPLGVVGHQRLRLSACGEAIIMTCGACIQLVRCP